MRRQAEKKICSLDELVDKVKQLQQDGRKVVQSHGVFDLIHPGIIHHLKQAAEQGDVLVVTVIRDQYVKRGSGRPVFPEDMRLENIAAIEDVDYVCLVCGESPHDFVNRIGPDVYAKGQAFYERDREVLEKIFEQERNFYAEKCRVVETEGFSLHTEDVLTRFLEKPTTEAEQFLSGFKEHYRADAIVDALESLDDLNVLVIGDGIIDEYHYCASMGKSAKSHLVVSRYLSHEVFAGGAFAVANHVAGICKHVQLVSLLGTDDTREEFVRGELKPNVDARFFYKQNSPTIVKKRYINEYLNQKLFEVNYINDDVPEKATEAVINAYLEEVLPDYDLVMVCDFGHGFLSPRLMHTVSQRARRWAANAQINAANVGYNLVTKFERPSFVCMDENELRIAAQNKHGKIEDVAARIRDAIGADCLICTLGKKGSVGVNGNDKVYRCPIFSSKVVDTVGSGDAFFSYTAPCYAKGLPIDLISFIGNAVGAMAVQIVGNKRSVEVGELVPFVRGLLR